MRGFLNSPYDWSYTGLVDETGDEDTDNSIDGEEIVISVDDDDTEVPRRSNYIRLNFCIFYNCLLDLKENSVVNLNSELNLNFIVGLKL